MSRFRNETPLRRIRPRLCEPTARVEDHSNRRVGGPWDLRMAVQKRAGVREHIAALGALPASSEVFGSLGHRWALEEPLAEDEVTRLLGPGATEVDVGQGPDRNRVVMADIAGNEFCVLRTLAPRNQPEPVRGSVAAPPPPGR